MSLEQNIFTAQSFLAGLGEGREPSEIAENFADDLIFEIQGDDGALPWIGRKTGRAALENFIRDIRSLTQAVRFEVEDILASETRVAIVGALETRINATGKIVATQFAIILTFATGTVMRFQMLEDSFNVSKAARC